MAVYAQKTDPRVEIENTENCHLSSCEPLPLFLRLDLPYTKRAFLKGEVSRFSAFWFPRKTGKQTIFPKFSNSTEAKMSGKLRIPILGENKIENLRNKKQCAVTKIWKFRTKKSYDKNIGLRGHTTAIITKSGV